MVIEKLFKQSYLQIASLIYTYYVFPIIQHF